MRFKRVQQRPPERQIDGDSVWGLLDCNGDGELERNELERDWEGYELFWARSLFAKRSCRSLPTEHVANGREQFGDNARAASTNAASSISTQEAAAGPALKFCVADNSFVRTSARRQRDASRGVDRRVRFP